MPSFKYLEAPLNDKGVNVAELCIGYYSAVKTANLFNTVICNWGRFTYNK